MLPTGTTGPVGESLSVPLVSFTMFTPGAGNYGCAWWIEDDGVRGRVAWHDGLLPGYRAEVVDDEGRPCPPGVVA